MLDDCPLGKDCVPGSPACKECSEHKGFKWTDSSLGVTKCAALDNTPLRVEFEISRECEATSSPWWLIIDPRQNFEVGNQGLHNIASMITGPFFSRKAAQRHLDAKQHRFSKNARVFCHSGHDTEQYAQKVRF